MPLQFLKKSIANYHIKDSVDQEFIIPLKKELLTTYYIEKNWIDTVQWHYEDIIRDPNINPEAALVLKRKIDASNQDRTDLVEHIDDYFLDRFKSVTIADAATINTESPAWAIDRLSILALKLYHMQEEVNRTDADEAHIAKCRAKLDVLKEQRTDLSSAIDQLLSRHGGRDKVYESIPSNEDV